MRMAKPEVTRADARSVEEWAAETEMDPNGAEARAGGRWRLVAAVKPTRDEARAVVRTLRAAGYPAEAVARDGAFAVQIPGLAGEAQARAVLEAVRGISGVSAPSVGEGS